MSTTTAAPDGGPSDPFELLRAAGAELLAAQHVRGALLSDMETDASADQGDALATARDALDALDPRAPAPSATITPELLRAAQYIQTADPADDGELREAVKLWRAAMDPPSEPPRRPVALFAIEGDPPAPLVSCARPDGSRHGAVLSAGTVCLLAGAGGTAKTALALHLAVETAATPDGTDREACGGALVVRGASALFATWEDAPPVLRMRGTALIEHLGDGYVAAGRRLHVLDLSGRPLYGPAERYGARPIPLAGWRDLWAAVGETGARLVVIDPALTAYVGESNAAGPVREFLGALNTKATANGAGVLLVAHSRKDARRPDASVYDAGHVGGSTHWTDGARAALTLTRAEGRYRLAVAKANYGPAFRCCDVAPIVPDGHPVVGFTAAADAWTDGEPPATKAEANGAAAKGAGAVPHEDMASV